MKYDIPLDFYPSPVKLTAGQKQRIRSLVQRQLAGEKVYNVMPQRSLAPILVLLAFALLTGVLAVQPGMRGILSEAAAKIVRMFVREDAEEETLPETEEETETDNTVMEVGAAAAVGDVQLTVDKVIRVEDGLYFHLELEHLTDAFAGDILQFDTLALAVNADPADAYKYKDPWLDRMTLQWGETGIYAGEVFALLDRSTPQSAVSYWLFYGTEKPEAGQYRLQIGRLFGCDTVSAEFVCTEYGDFEVVFSLDELPEVLPTTRLTTETVFRIGEMEYTLTSLAIEPLSVAVEITCGRDSTFAPEGFPALQLTPIHNLFGMFYVTREREMDEAEANTLQALEYSLVPYYGTDVLPDRINSHAGCRTYHNDLAETDCVDYHFALADPIKSSALVRLVLERNDGGDAIVIWEAE